MRKFFIIFLFAAACVAVSCSNAVSPVPDVIFDTDIGGDIDDVLALQMVINYHNSGKINLAAVTISKDNRKSILLVDGICRFNGIEGVDIGFASNGKDPDDYYYLNPVLGARRRDGSPLISPLVDTSSVEDGYKVMRRRLAESKDGNAIIITVGSFCNMSNLLLSGPDEISPLNGVELVARKVSKVCVMGGTFDPDNIFPEWNIKGDIPSSQRLFELCPVTMVVSGYEVGSAVLYPAESIEKDFGEVDENPLTVAYTHYAGMPFCRPTWDLSSTYDAVMSDRSIYGISEPGCIKVDDQGITSFTPDRNGHHYYLTVSPERVNAAQNALVEAVTNRQ
jgi:purine nucleosidase